MKYKIYFEIYNKKLRTEVEAGSEKEAEKIVRNKLKIVKIVKQDEVEFLRNIFGMN